MRSAICGMMDTRKAKNQALKIKNATRFPTPWRCHREPVTRRAASWIWSGRSALRNESRLHPDIPRRPCYGRHPTSDPADRSATRTRKPSRRQVSFSWFHALSCSWPGTSGARSDLQQGLFCGLIINHRPTSFNYKLLSYFISVFFCRSLRNICAAVGWVLAAGFRCNSLSR